MTAPEIAAWEHLDAAVSKLWRIEAGIAGLTYVVLFGLVGWGANAALEGEAPIHLGLAGAVLGALLLAWQFYVAGKRYEYWRFLVGEDDLAVAHGIWWRTRIYVPRARIQHVDVTAGPIARALGLAVVSVFVGGHSGAVATIPGLRAERAESLRQTLLRVTQPGAPPPTEEPHG